jgi:hypothetical protein
VAVVVEPSDEPAIDDANAEDDDDDDDNDVVVVLVVVDRAR